MNVSISITGRLSYSTISAISQMNSHVSYITPDNPRKSKQFLRRRRLAHRVQVNYIGMNTSNGNAICANEYHKFMTYGTEFPGR